MTDLRDQLQADLGSAYTLEKELGGGGMSRVFLARDNNLGRQVVIKILPPEMAAAVSSQRFRREVQLAANLQHAHIVPLHSAGETNGLPYFTMPFVKGESLKAHLAKVGELPLSEAIRILREVASALAYAHDNGIVHRDIKPDNVLISGDSAVVTDFGVAKALTASSGSQGSSLTSMGVALGTPAYMAPEQATADPHTDHRADIYALGVMAYEMISGTTPFANRTPQATLAAHVTEMPEHIARKRPNTPAGLAAIVMRCLEKRAADRPQSAREVVNLLDALTTPSGGLTPTAAYRVPSTRPKWMIPATAGLIIALGLGAVAFTQFGSRETDAVETFKAQRSIAVLPFKNVGGDPANEYFSDGLSEELMNTVGLIPGLRVAARASSFQFKNQNIDVREIGKKLGVETVVDGSVQKAGNRVRISAQLIDTKNGNRLWSESFDRSIDDVFAVQNEITRLIGTELSARFNAEKVRFTAGRPVKAEAYEMYLKGIAAIRGSSESETKKALLHFEQAIAADSGYAAAWAQVANLYNALVGFGFMKPEEARLKHEHALSRARDLEPDLPLVQITYAQYLRAKGQLREAEGVLKGLLEKNPNHLGAHHAYAGLLAARGDARGAIREAEIAGVLNPLGTNGQNLAIYKMLAGEYADAVAILRKVVALTPDDPYSLVTLVQGLSEVGQHDEAMRLADKASGMAPGDTYLELMKAYSFAKAGRRAEALSIADAEAVKPDAVNYGFEMAGVHAALGDKDKAFEWLGKLETVQGMFVKLDPMLLPIHSDPRFQKFLAKWQLN